MNIDYTRPKLAKYQTDILDAKERFTITEACTKSGKTVSHIVWLFEQALSDREHVNEEEKQDKEGMEYWWVAPVYSQADIAFKRMQMFISDRNIFTANGSKMTITLSNGAIMRFKSADNADNLYGSNCYAAVFDEFTRAKESAWTALRSTLTHTKGKVKFIGNYVGSSNWGHILGEKAKTDSNYKYFKIDAYDAVEAGILDIEEVEQAREDLPSNVFNALYLAQGSLEDDILFTSEMLRNVFNNENLFVNESKRYLTADLALHGSDRFTLNLWYDWKLVKVWAFDKMDGKEVEIKIKEVAKKYNVPIANIAYDADGLGAYLRGYLKAAKPFHNNAKPIKESGKNTVVNYENLKAQCYYKLADKMEDNLVWFADKTYEGDIRKELAVIRKVIKDNGKVGINKKKDQKKLLGHSPDFADGIIPRAIFDIGKRKIKRIRKTYLAGKTDL